jgi:hypothetical protein
MLEHRAKSLGHGAWGGKVIYSNWVIYCHSAFRISRFASLSVSPSLYRTLAWSKCGYFSIFWLALRKETPMTSPFS